MPIQFSQSYRIVKGSWGIVWAPFGNSNKEETAFSWVQYFAGVASRLSSSTADCLRAMHPSKASRFLKFCIPGGFSFLSNKRGGKHGLTQKSF